MRPGAGCRKDPIWLSLGWFDGAIAHWGTADAKGIVSE